MIARIGCAVLVALSIASCGYRSAKSALNDRGKLAVVAGPSGIADDAVMRDTVFALRMALAREGVLANGGYPRVVVEVLRADERSLGVAAVGGMPLARGTTVSLTGRAVLEAIPGQGGGFDTGDVRVTGDFAAENDPRVESQRHDDSLRELARRLGDELGVRVLGLPGARDERL